LVWLLLGAALVPDGWLVEDKDDGWFVEADDDGWFVEADEDGALVPSEPEDCDGALVPLIELLEDDGDALEDEPPDCCPHCCCAAWVFGPMMPSTGPGSQPCAFSCCCSWRTDSSPCEALPDDADGALVPAEPEVPLDEADGALVEALLLEAEGWLVEAEGCSVELLLLDGIWAGALVEDGAVTLDEGDCEDDDEGWFCAMAPVAARTAATIASFLNCMVRILCLALGLGSAEKARGQTTEGGTWRVPSTFRTERCAAPVAFLHATAVPALTPDMRDRHAGGTATT
jgi:hypothetical protein